MIESKISQPLLKVQRLEKHFPVKASYFSRKTLTLKAVDDVNFDLYPGETLGMVGESGCGKTTVGRSVLRLYKPEEGRVYLNPRQEVVNEVDQLDFQRLQLRDEYRRMATKGNKTVELRAMDAKMRELKLHADEATSQTDILCMNSKNLKAARKDIQMIFQDPWASLNPHMMVKDIVGEGSREYNQYQGSSLNAWVMELLDRVGLPRAAANRYPHEFSGGQRQRICVARALALNPKVVVCDEPVSALDVSIQAQVLNLLIGLQDEFDLSYLFIAHDLSVVEYISDRVAVMYLGKMVEGSPASQLYAAPRHPYTKSLLSSVPIADPELAGVDAPLSGDVPSPVNPPSGCSFHPRCPLSTDICRQQEPQLTSDGQGRMFSCHHPLGL